VAVWISHDLLTTDPWYVDFNREACVGYQCKAKCQRNAATLRTSLKVLLIILGKPPHFQIGSSGKLATFFFYLFYFLFIYFLNKK